MTGWRGSIARVPYRPCLGGPSLARLLRAARLPAARDSVDSLKGLTCNVVESGTVLVEEVLPESSVPDFRMVVNTQQNDVALQSGEFHQTLGDANSPLCVELHALGTRIKQSLVILYFDSI